VKNGLITGFHRSGTTLVCHLLNKVPNVVALDEPLDVASFRFLVFDEIVAYIENFLHDQRRSIRELGFAISKTQSGRVPCNQLSDDQDGHVRKSVVDGNLLSVDNVDGCDFDLYIKHPAVFTALLGSLENYYPCYVSIRNPLSILLSWRATPFNVSQGRAPAAEMIDPKLAQRLDRESKVLSRQLILIDYFFSRYAEARSVKIVRYEDLVSSGGRALVALEPRAEILDEPLVSRNDRYLRHDDAVKEILHSLLAADNACWDFYSKNEVIALAAQGGILI
jgi:hypothetical protein